MQRRRSSGFDVEPTWLVASQRSVTGMAGASEDAGGVEAVGSHDEALDSGDDIVYAHDLQGNFLSINDAGVSILGYSVEEIIGMNISDVLAPEHLALARSKFEAKLEHGGETRYEVDMVAKSGHTVRLELTSRAVSAASGARVVVHGVARSVDVSSRNPGLGREPERGLRGMIEHASEAKVLVDREGVLTYLSPGAIATLQLSGKRVLGTSIFEFVHPEDVDAAREAILRNASAKGEERGEFRLCTSEGRPLWLAFVAYGEVGASDDGSVLLSFFDVTERKGNERRLEELVTFQNALMNLVEESLQEGLTEDFYHRVLACAVDVIPGAQAGSLLARDEDGRCHFVAAEGFDAEELGRTFLYEHELHRNPALVGPQIVNGFERGRVEDADRSHVLYDAGRGAEIQVTLSTPIELEGTPVMYFHLDNFDDPNAFSTDAVNMARAFSNYIATVLKRFRLEADLRQERAALDTMAYTDSLTGLSNRRMFYRRAQEALAAMGETTSLAVLFFDLDAFKVVNDSLGHQFGDLLLEAVAKRLVACVREGDTVSRWGGDEFVLLLPDAGSKESIGQLAERIIQRINAPFSVKDQMISIGCSIGIAVSRPRRRASIDELTREADIALYQAKEHGRNRHRIYLEGSRVTGRGKMSLEDDLLRAVESRDLVLELTPRVDLATGRVAAYRADLGWNHPELGHLGFAELESATDSEALREPVFVHLVELACERIVASGPDPERLSIAIELFPALLRSARTVDAICALVEERGVKPSQLEMTVPAGSVMRGRAEIAEAVERLTARGFGLSILGSGSSMTSVDVLQQLPIQTLVIHRDLVARVTGDETASSTQVMKAMIAMARSLGMRTVADGVEDEIQAELLAGIGFDFGQGRWASVLEASRTRTHDRR